MKEKEDIFEQLKDMGATIEKAMGQMTDSFVIKPTNMPEFTEEFFLEGLSEQMEIAKEMDLVKTNGKDI